jgi:CDGSH-type Zn-finger protein/truncated hemoglobin YjbI/ferredoxin
MPDKNFPTPDSVFHSILARACDLKDGIALALSVTHGSDSQAKAFSLVSGRLDTTVIRPLQEALAEVRATPESEQSVRTAFASKLGDAQPVLSIAALDEALWALAKDATTQQVDAKMLPQAKEAAAGLQYLACELATTNDDANGKSSAAARLAELKAMQTELPAGIQAESNGPYLVTNGERLFNWLGERIPLCPLTALCRCGQSATKPFCDGAHARSNFTDQKDPERVPDRRDTYDGQQATILDNRGTCAHSGFCTDRLSTVFRLGKEPFVAPSGGRLDDIVHAVRACPSGALSLAFDGREAREQVNQVRPAAIEVSKDGPYRITGGLSLTDGQGNAERFNDGASLEHYSLCRCGHSQNKPFCSGMHWFVKFSDPAPDHEPTIFEWAGGFPALTRMTKIFYSKYVPEDPLIGPLFANMSPDHPERVAAWLGEVFGGPKNYSHEYGGYTRMVSQHLGKGLTEAQRARWVSLICRSADEAGLPADPEFRAAFVSYIEWGSRLALENSQPGAKPPMNMPVPQWWWVCGAKPGSRISALAPAEEIQQPIALPGPNESVNFINHIKPLFRKMDRESMSFVFDLWSFGDVRTHASEILKRLRSGTMPCDGAWPKERVELFRIWVESGMAES